MALIEDFLIATVHVIPVYSNTKSENDYIRHGVGIYSVPDTYGNETPDFYIKLYQDGTLLQNTDNNPVESDLDHILNILDNLNASSNYEIKVYDKDLFMMII